MAWDSRLRGNDAVVEGVIVIDESSPHPAFAANCPNLSLSPLSSHLPANSAALPHVGVMSGTFGSGAVATIVAIRL